MTNYVTGNWSWSVPSSRKDWIGVYDAAADVSVDDYLWFQYIHPAGSTSGTFTTANTTDGDAWMPTVVGSSYVMYYFRSDSFVNVTRSEIFTAVDVSTTVTLFVSLRTLYTGNAVSVSWVSNTPAQQGDWIGLFSTADESISSNVLWWHYVVTGARSGTLTTSDTTDSKYTWYAPALGQYEFRYLCCDGYSTKYKSPTITVISGDVISDNESSHGSADM